MIHKIDEETNEINDNYGKVHCYLLCMSGGWTPVVHLFTQSGGKLDFDNQNFCFYPKKETQDQISIGSCNGTFKLGDIINESIKKTNEYLNQKHENNIQIDEVNEGNLENIWLLPSDKPLGKIKPFIEKCSERKMFSFVLSGHNVFR